MKKSLLFLSLITYSISSQNINGIEFKGLTQISNEIALETINLKDNSKYTLPEIDKAIKKFYSFNYFNDISVSNIDNKLVFNFVEKPFIAKLEITGYKNREDEINFLFQTMGLQKGTMYTPQKIESAKKQLLVNLEREGYIHSTIEIDVETLSDTSVKVTFNVNKGMEVIIDKISYKGLKAFDISEVESVIANKEEDCCFTWFFGQNDGELDLEQLKYDSLRIKDLYLQNGFLDAQVTPAFSKIDFNINRAEIEYSIIEGKQYKVNDILIYMDKDLVDVESIYPQLYLEKSKIFNINKLRKDQNFIKSLIADKGYAYTKVNYDIKANKEDNTVTIIYNIISNEKVYIDDVIISGNNRTLDRVIRRNIYLAPNDLYNLTDIKASKNKLKRTGFFESIEIKEEQISKNRMILSVVVTEAPTGNFILGGGYGSYDGFLINASISDKNIFGSGLDLGLSLDHSNKKDTFEISLKNPAIRDSIYNGNINIYQKESLIENNDINSNYGDETTTTTGLSVGVGRLIGRDTRIGVSYSIDNIKENYELNNTYETKYTTSAITPYISFNNTDDYYTPRAGMIASSSLKIAGIGGDARYLLSSSSFKYFYSLDKALDKDWILRYKTNVKMLQDTGNIPDGTTFYMGGTSSVRGYQSYAFQPDDNAEPYGRTWTNTFEMSFPLVKSAKMRWALFYDYGMIGENSFNDISKSGYGALVSWLSPVGPLQFIFSRPINPDEDDKTSHFEFNLGGKF